MTDANKREEEALTRLSLANAMIRLWIAAYDALLTTGVNMRSLPEFNDTTDIDRASKLPLQDGRRLIIRWIGRVHSAIQAAIRRKGFKVIE